MPCCTVGNYTNIIATKHDVLFALLLLTVHFEVNGKTLLLEGNNLNSLLHTDSQLVS